MALTMTRTRIQTTLARLAELLANLNGELEFVEWLLDEMQEHRALLTTRRTKLAEECDAVVLTLRQFDPELDTSTVSTLGVWAREYERGNKAKVLHYLKQLSGCAGHCKS